MRRTRQIGQRLAAGLDRLRASARARGLGKAGRGLMGIAPALLAGAGVFLVAAGLFNYTAPASAEPNSTATAEASPSSPDFTVPPISTESPGGSVPLTAIATRIVIPALSIDLPIVAPPPHEEFPLCDAAEYWTAPRDYAHPGMPQAIYLYAHARKGMFLPLLTNSRVNGGASMIGMWVEIYTDDDQRHVYEITEVLRHLPVNESTLDRAISATTDQLWLQTSEGRYASSLKLQIVAMPIGVVAASHAAAHPTSQGRVCPDAPRCDKADGGGCRK